MAVRVSANGVKQLADKLIAVKGVMHGKFTMTTTGKEF